MIGRWSGWVDRRSRPAAVAAPPAGETERASPGGKIYVLLCAIVALVPLPFGAARPLAWDALAICVAALLLASLRIRAPLPIGLRHRLLWPALLFALVIGWIILQTVPWMPVAWHAPTWAEAAKILPQPVVGAIAVDRQAVLSHLLRLLCYAGVFYLSLILCLDPARAYGALKLVALSGSFYAAYGLLIYWSGNTTVVGMAKWAYAADLTGPFVNRNSFATYLGICMLAVAGHLLTQLQDLYLPGDWRTNVIAILEFLGKRAWLMVCLFVVATALVLTHSRGGFIAAFSGFAALAFAVSWAPSLGGSGHARWVALLSGLAVLALAISGGPTLNRLVDSDAAERVAVYRSVLEAIADNPLTGTGLGSFPAVFAIYRTADVVNDYEMAHSDYLENLLELGIPAACCLFAALLWLAALCWRGARARRQHAIFPCLGFAASVLVGVHAMTDFSLQIPAVATLYVFILGIGVAHSQSSRATVH